MKERIKRKLAMFLAVCLVLTSFQGVAWADSESESRDVTIALSGEKIREAAENAIRSGFLYENQYSFENADSDEAGEPESYKNLFDGSTGSVFVLDEIPYANEASASEAIPDDAELQMFVKISEEAKAERASKSEADRASSSETAIDTANYELRGDETIIFLFINRSNDELNFQLDIDGRKSGIVTVESGSSLLSEEETVPAEETAAEELETEEAGPGGEVPDAEAPADGSNGGVSGGSSSDGSSLTEDETNPADESQAADTETDENGSADENGSEAEDKPENNTPDAGDIHTGNETVTDSKDQTESNENTNTSGSESAGKPEDKETTQPEASDNNSSSDEDQKNGGNENQSGSAETGDTGSESSDSSEAGSHSDSGNSEEKSSSGSEGNSGSDSSSEKGSAGSSGSGSSEKGSDSSSDGGSSSDSSSDVQVSMSSYSVPRVMSINGPSGIDGGDEEDEDMDFEDWQDMQPDDEDEDEEESCDDDVMTYSDSYDGVDLAAEVLPTVLVKRNRVRLFRALFGENATSAAVMTASLDSLTRAAGTTNFDVTLYDYSETGKSEAVINKYLEGKNAKIRFNITANSIYPIGNYYWWSNPKTYNIVQGLVPKTYNEDSFNGNFFNETDLFPKEQGSINESAVKVYSDVNLASDFFSEDEDGYYMFDSNQTSAFLNSKNGNVLSSTGGTQGKFWPFGSTDWYFGMKMNFDFYMPKEGKVNGKDLTFEFSGDDDVWVYLKPKDSQDATSYLILDIGGNHGQMDGKVNFATGEIEYSYPNASDVQKNANVVTHIYDETGTAAEVTKEPTDGKYYASLYTKAATINRVVKEKGYTLEQAESYVEERYIDFMGFEEAYDNKTYQLGFYYLERGGNDSNCKMKFNLPVIPKTGVKIQKQIQGELPSANATFNFNVISSSSEEKLKAYKNGTGNEEDVRIIPCSVSGAGSVQAELESGSYFYVEESAATAGKSVKWDVTGGKTDTATGNTTNIYQIKEESGGFLLQCTNIYGELDPAISKSAWKDAQETGDSIYDIALQVSGDTMTTVEGQDSGANVLYVLDNSYSMKNGNRMKDLKDAIKTSLNGLKDKNGVSVAMFAYDDSINAKFNNGDWAELDDTTLSQLTEFYTNLSYQELTGSTGNTNSAQAFREALDVFGKTKNNAKKYLIFVTDGDPCGYGKSEDDDYEIAARKAGDALRAKYGTDELSIFMVGVGDSLNNDWWMNPASVEGIPTSGWPFYRPTQTKVTYPTSYHHVTNSSDLSNLFKELTNEITTTTHITNPKVTDTLSGYVSPVNVDAAADVPMTVWLYNGKLGEAGVTDEVKAQSEKLTGSVSDGVVTYRTSDGTEIAKYNTSTKTLEWTVAAELSSEQTKTLIYRVKVTGVYDENKFVDPDENTGTHSIAGQTEKGYHSNERAVLTYNGGEEKDFPHPVVRPVPYGSLTIKKLVTDSAGEYQNQKFSFEVTLSGLTVDKFTAGTAEALTEYQPAEGSKTLTFELAGGETYYIQGLNAEAAYMVGEKPDSLEDVYFSTLANIAVQKDNAEDKAVTKSGSTVSGTMQREGSVAADVEVTYTNVFDKRDSISVVKKTEGDPGVEIPTSEVYTFQVYKVEGEDRAPFNDFTLTAGSTAAEKLYSGDDTSNAQYGMFKITGAGTAELIIGKDHKGASFQIEEIGKGTAGYMQWSDGSQNAGEKGNEFSALVSDGGTVTCTNYYTNNTILIKKLLSDDSYNLPEADEAAKWFTYKVTLDEYQGTSVKAEDAQDAKKLDGAALTAGSEITLTEESGKKTFTFKMKADGSLKLGNIPFGTSYTVEETGMADADMQKKYEYQLVEATRKDSDNPDGLAVVDSANKPNQAVAGSFVNVTSDAGKNQEITYTNKLTRAIGKLTIVKKLEEKAEEAAAFTFKIRNTETKQEFYATVTVPKGEITSSLENLEVPAGSYVITEQAKLRYTLVSSNPENGSVTVKAQETATAEFTNRKSSDRYFSDTDTKVNTVKKDGFQKTDPETPASSLSPKALLSSIYGDKKEQDEE